MKKVLFILSLSLVIFVSCEKTCICSYEKDGNRKYSIEKDKDAFIKEHENENPECN